MFFLLYKRTDNGVFDDFPKISENFQKLSRRADERSRTLSDNFRKFPKISEDFQRLPKTFNPDVTEIIVIFTCEDIISSHVRISYRFYQLFVTTRYTTDFYNKSKLLASLENIFWADPKNLSIHICVGQQAHRAFPFPCYLSLLP